MKTTWKTPTNSQICLSGHFSTVRASLDVLEDTETLRQSIITGKMAFGSAWNDISADGRDFVTRLLQVAPSKRYSPLQG